MNKHKITAIFMFILSIILAFIRLPIFLYAPFLTLDISLLPFLLLIRTSRFRTILLLLICKSALLTYAQGANILSLIGNLSDLLFGVVMISLYVLLKKDHHIKSQLIIIFITTLTMVVTNMIIIFPIYHLILKINLSHWLLWGAILPFNIIKCSLLLVLNNIIVNRKLI